MLWTHHGLACVHPFFGIQMASLTVTETLRLAMEKARLNVKSQANRNYLRHIWLLIDPLLYFAVFYFVFEILLLRGGDDFTVFLIIGLVFFQWFSKSVTHASGSICEGRFIISRMHISPLFFPMASIFEVTFCHGPVFFIAFTIILADGFAPQLQWVSIFLILLAEFALIVGVSFTLALVAPFVGEIRLLIPSALTFLMFLSGVFYKVSVIPPQWSDFFLLNPMANLLMQFRLVIMEGSWPDGFWLSLLYVQALLCLLVAAWIYRRLGSEIPRVVLN